MRMYSVWSAFRSLTGNLSFNVKRAQIHRFPHLWRWKPPCTFGTLGQHPRDILRAALTFRRGSFFAPVSFAEHLPHGKWHLGSPELTTPLDFAAPAEEFMNHPQKIQNEDTFANMWFFLVVIFFQSQSDQGGKTQIKQNPWNYVILYHFTQNQRA